MPSSADASATETTSRVSSRQALSTQVLLLVFYGGQPKKIFKKKQHQKILKNI